jgi:hypothetical protein
LPTIDEDSGSVSLVLSTFPWRIRAWIRSVRNTCTLSNRTPTDNENMEQQSMDQVTGVGWYLSTMSSPGAVRASGRKMIARSSREGKTRSFVCCCGNDCSFSSTGKHYWADGARALGVYEDPGGGLRWGAALTSTSCGLAASKPVPRKAAIRITMLIRTIVSNCEPPGRPASRIVR